MQAVTKQMSFFFPVMIFVIGLLFPQGLAIYWVTGSIFMVAQQFYVVGWGGLKVPHWFPGAGRETPLSFPKAEPARALVSANGSKNTARAAKDDDRAAPAGEEPAATARTPGARQVPRQPVRTGARPSQRVRRRRKR